jgi:hypothetical protein
MGAWSDFCVVRFLLPPGTSNATIRDSLSEGFFTIAK